MPVGTAHHSEVLHENASLLFEISLNRIPWLRFRVSGQRKEARPMQDPLLAKFMAEHVNTGAPPEERGGWGGD